MFIKRILHIFVIIFSVSCLAKSEFTCKLIIDKNTCWKDFDVEIHIYDPYETPFKAKGSMHIKKGELRNEMEFPCKSREYVTLRAKFSPTIWEGKEDEVYRSKKTWVIPTEISNDAVDWRINLCYPEDFQSVPQPTGALRNCKCMRKKVAAVKIDASGQKTEIDESEAQKLKKEIEKKKKKQLKELQRQQRREAIKQKRNANK